MSTEVLPVTKDQMTQTEIGYSIKVGKQVIKKQLEQEINELIAKCETETKFRNDTFNGSTFCRWLEDEAEKLALADPALTGLRNALDPFLTKITLNDNKDLFNGGITSMAVLEGIRGEYSHRNTGYLEEVLEKGLVEVSFEFALNIQSDCNDECPDAFFEIPLTDEWKTILVSYKGSKDKSKGYSKQIVELNSKLSNLDGVMEEVEATILANELRQSESGRKVLEISAGIIGDVLGKTPSLLQIDKESECRSTKNT